MMIDEHLSPEGLLRRDAILQLAKSEARRRRSRRLLSRGGAAVLVVGLISAALRLMPIPVKPVEVRTSVARSLPVPTPPSVVIEYVQTDPTIAERLTLQPSPPRWEKIGDDELLNELAAAGQPAGIAIFNGKTLLLTRAQVR